MAPLVLPYLWAPVFRNRPPVFYYRRGALRIRLPSQTNRAAFLAAYAAAHALGENPAPAASAACPPGSLGHLVASYRASSEWSGLAENSRKDYEKALRPLEKQYGHVPYRTMPRVFVFTLRDRFAILDTGERDATGAPIMRPSPRRANRMVNVLRILLGWAYNRGLVTSNVALSPGQLTTGPGYTAWTAEAFGVFMASADEPLRRAAALGFYTGMRKQDCLSALWSARQGGVIVCKPAKTTKKTAVVLILPERAELTAVLEAAPRTCEHMLTRADGKPWLEDGFNHAFAKAVKAAGLVGLSFHGLRKGASVALAERGATDAELGAVLGHMDPRMVKLYRDQANQRALAASAMAKMTPGT